MDPYSIACLAEEATVEVPSSAEAASYRAVGVVHARLHDALLVPLVGARLLGGHEARADLGGPREAPRRRNANVSRPRESERKQGNR